MQRQHVVVGHQRIGPIGKDRIKRLAHIIHAVPHGGQELGITPAADPRTGAGGDVGAVEDAKGRLECAPAGEGHRGLWRRRRGCRGGRDLHGVAANATGGPRDIGTPVGQPGDGGLGQGGQIGHDRTRPGEECDRRSRHQPCQPKHPGNPAGALLLVLLGHDHSTVKGACMPAM